MPKQESGREHRYVWGKRLAISTCIGLIYGLSFGFDLGPDYTLNGWQISGFSYGIGIGLGSLFLQLLLMTPLHLPTLSGSGATWQLKQVLCFFRSLQIPHILLVTAIIGLSVCLSYGLSIGLGYGLSYGLSIGLDNGLSIGLSNGLGFGLKYGLSIGLSYGLISLTLGAQMGDVRLTERLRWTRRSMRRGLFNFRHLHITLLLAGVVMVFVGLSYALIYGLSDGLSDGMSHGLSYDVSIGLNYALSYGSSVALSVALSYWSLVGLIQGITQEHIEDQDRCVVNQGIHRSLYNSVSIGIIGGPTIGIIGTLSYSLSNALNGELGRNMSNGLSYTLLMSICGTLLLSLLIGGLAVLRHYTIRFLLWQSSTFPWQTPQFLSDATDRLLLRPVSGGYSFTHRLLLDHFADLNVSTSRTQAQIIHPHDQVNTELGK